MLDTLEQTILSSLQIIFDEFGWAGVFSLMILENATGITPSEVILAFAGWMLIERHGISPAFIPLAGFYAGLGSAIGASIMYWVARIGGRPVIDRFAKHFHIDLHYIERVEEQVGKWGAGIIMFGRLLPGIRTLINIPAGLARVPFPKFFLATFLGAYMWCTLLIGAGYILGHEWMLIGGYIKANLPLILLLVFFALASWFVYHYRASISRFGWIHSNNKRLN